jgi:hypothetical protein
MWKGLAIFFGVVGVVLSIVFVVNHFTKTKHSSPKTVPDEKDSQDTKIKCRFEGEDIFNKHVFHKSGKLIEDEKTFTDCETCSDYVLKEDGSCYSMMFDTTYNDESDISDKDDPKNKEARRMCTAEMKSSACPF